MTTHAQAAALGTAAFAKVIGRAPAVPELRLLLAKGFKESGYGSGWKRPDGDSGQWPPNNIGAVQVPAGGWAGESFIYTDTHANGQKYQWRFKKYPTPEAGWEDFVRELFVNPSKGRSAVLAAASADDPWAFSYQVVATGYSESRGATLKDRAIAHYKWIAPSIETVDKALGFGVPAHDSSGGGSAWPFPPVTAPPAPPPEPPMVDPNATLLKALADNTLALGTLHQDIAALRRDLADLHATVARVQAAMLPALL
jgi:hypothetical protein